MSQNEPVFRNIMDTARWAAVYRAREYERKDALFKDPFAKRLAGEQGKKIAQSMASQEQHDWAWVTRTYLHDRYIARQIQEGADMVVNLAAGLDARPYRMVLPSSLKWVEVDLPEILAYKEDVLKDEKPACMLERMPLNLSDVEGRRDLFSRLGGQSKRALIITEGLLIYLTAEEVGALAQDLAAAHGFQHWSLEITSPGLLLMLQKQLGAALNEAQAPLKFGPEEGPEFFTHYGWQLVEVQSMFKNAARAKRVPFWMRLMARLPESQGRQGSRPWSGVCLFVKKKS